MTTASHCGLWQEFHSAVYDNSFKLWTYATAHTVDYGSDFTAGSYDGSFTQLAMTTASHSRLSQKLHTVDYGSSFTAGSYNGSFTQWAMTTASHSGL
ncbi:hypothetical protein PoB_002660300 [Plakobranchus ocellatus]|uniref:Uncharacterized protein n=1 Tax=Plakobranchus ocellatus TaxID=259542 RepID=A0AAV3ZYY6_9GAST|nr:hypothetical protein PoB_002660300 [Plakobranchus ocellatus]